MATNSISTPVRILSPNTSVIEIVGEMNRNSENVLMDAYSTASQGSTRNIVLNFSKMDYMNSSGIGLLVTLLIRVQRQQQKLVAVGLSEHYKTIFELTRLNEAIEIYPNEDEVIATLD